MRIEARETAILAESYSDLISWYKDVFEMKPTFEHTEGYHYTILANDYGLKVGITKASEMEVVPGDRKLATQILQVAVEDIKEFFKKAEAHGGSISFGPSYSEEEKFWYGGIADKEGNPIWVVDLSVQ
jgi:predicted enzyme related to lactoylglutathione lyase